MPSQEKVFKQLLKDFTVKKGSHADEAVVRLRSGAARFIKTGIDLEQEKYARRVPVTVRES